MKCFTVSSGLVTPGIRVETRKLTGAQIEILVATVGEEGRGRRLGILPVDPQACAIQPGPDRSGLVLAANIWQTRAGSSRLIPETITTSEVALVCLPTPIGFRGGNSHTGERSDVPCPQRGQQQYSYCCPECKLERPLTVASGAIWTHSDEGVARTFPPFPGTILVSGIIAEGGAGRMGSGEQLIATIPRWIVFRTAYSGRLYGKPSSHYYVFDGEKILAATWEEREASDVF